MPRTTLAVLAALLACAFTAAPAPAAGQTILVRTFRPVSVKGTTMLFRLHSVKPENVQRATLVTGGRSYAVSAAVVRQALRTKRLLRTRLTAAVAARVRHKSARRNARLKIYVVHRKTATAPKPKPVPQPKKKAATTPAKGTAGGSTGTQTPTAPAPKKAAAGITTFPCGTWGTFDADHLPGACWHPYGPNSPFNRALPASPRLAPDSQDMVDTMTGWGAPEEPYVGAADTSSDWNHPYYFSKPTDPVFTVHCTRSWGTCEVEGMQVHIPDAARAAGGGDGHMAVIDQVEGWEYDFWQVASKPAGGGQLTISWGGRTRIGTDDADGLGSDATAALFGLVAGVIRYPEMEAGSIDHALFLIIKCSRGKVYPAQGLGSDCADGHAPAMGQHLYLDMSDSDIASLDAADWQKTILTAMAHYGMFVGDTGGSPWGVEFESGSTYTSFGQADPWVAWAKQQPDETDWHGSQYLPRISGVDWKSRLKVVDPCVDQGTC